MTESIVSRSWDLEAGCPAAFGRNVETFPLPIGIGTAVLQARRGLAKSAQPKLYWNEAIRVLSITVEILHTIVRTVTRLPVTTWYTTHVRIPRPLLKLTPYEYQSRVIYAIQSRIKLVCIT